MRYGMKGRIDKYGRLWIKHGEKDVACECYRSGADEKLRKICSHKCVLFRDPEKKLGDRATLTLCKVTYEFDELIDERKA